MQDLGVQGNFVGPLWQPACCGRGKAGFRVGIAGEANLHLTTGQSLIFHGAHQNGFAPGHHVWVRDNFFNFRIKNGLGAGVCCGTCLPKIHLRHVLAHALG